MTGRIPLLLAFIAAMFCHAGQLSAASLAKPRYRVEIDGLNAALALDRIRAVLSLPIHCESEEIDSTQTKGITVKERVAVLREEQRKGRFSLEKQRQLDHMEGVAKDHPESIIDWNVPRGAGFIEGNTPREVLDAYCAKFPIFTYEKYGDQWVVHPKKSVLDFKIEALSVQNKTLAEVMSLLSPQMEGQHIGFLQVSTGPGPSILEYRFSKLDLPALPAREFFTRLAQSVGPNFYWGLAGFKGNRCLGFGGHF